jgi:hypothetical protein
MKSWRVGTLSMGLSLVLVGITLLISMWNGSTAFDTLITWWPIVFVLLGLEILIYVAIKGKEQSVVHYDMFSILFVGVLCFLCIGFALAAGSGLTQEIRQALGSENRTYDLPEIEQSIPAGVTKIIVQSSGAVPTIDTITSREVHLFGNYNVTHSQEDAPVLHVDDVASIRTIDHTMYISIKELPKHVGLNESYPHTTLTLAFPQDVPYELRGRNNKVIMPND